MLLNSETTKEEKEAEINKKINEIKKKNAEIIERHKEVERDKKNAEKLSQNALMRIKQDTRCDLKNITRETKTDSKKECKTKYKTIRRNQEEEEIVNIYRPQRLSENDAPPPDPAFSYLTDRLRDGAFCSPIITNSLRKISTSTSSNSSRKTSTVSNSSWTSSASSSSSKCNGFADYQLPWDYTASKNIKNKFRRNSSNYELYQGCKKERSHNLLIKHMTFDEEQRENIILVENNELRAINIPISADVETATEKRNKRDNGKWKSSSCSRNQETSKFYNWRDSCPNKRI